MTKKDTHIQDSESDMDSEDEWQNQDFFESSVFWNHEQRNKKAPFLSKDTGAANK